MIKLIFFISALCALNSVKGQDVPSFSAFTQWLFNAAATEVDKIIDRFTFGQASPKDISFYVYTPSNKILKYSPENAGPVSNLDFSKPTKVLIHGWQASGFDSFSKDMADKYHKSGDYNFISVDWSRQSRQVYMQSAASTKDIGYMLGDFILELIQNRTDLLQNFHLIGVSLGGHVAGFAGQQVAVQTGKRIKRITGLDVAAPLFEFPRTMDPKSRLSADDAELVDVIHTNIGFLGVSGAIGTADFYVESGGPIQTGCLNSLNIFDSIACSHGKAFEYFVESINGKKFEAISCPNSVVYHLMACNNNNKAIMGENVTETATGTFYLEVDSALPYGKWSGNIFGVKIELPKLPFWN